MADGIDSGISPQASGGFTMQDVMRLKQQMSLAQSLLGNKGQQSSAVPMQQPAPTTTATSINPPTSMNSPYGGAANAASQMSNAVQQRNSQMGQMLQGMPGGGGGGLMNSLDLAVGGPGMGGGGPGLVSDLWNGAGSALSSLGSLFGGGTGTGAAAAAGGAAAGVGGAAALDAAAGGLGAASGGEAIASLLPYLAILFA